MVAQLYKLTKNPVIVHLQWVNFMLSKLPLNIKAAKNCNQQGVGVH